jgi:hypothetical protein
MATARPSCGGACLERTEGHQPRCWHLTITPAIALISLMHTLTCDSICVQHGWHRKIRDRVATQRRRTHVRKGTLSQSNAHSSRVYYGAFRIIKQSRCSDLCGVNSNLGPEHFASLCMQMQSVAQIYHGKRRVRHAAKLIRISSQLRVPMPEAHGFRHISWPACFLFQNTGLSVSITR